MQMRNIRAAQLLVIDEAHGDHISNISANSSQQIRLQHAHFNQLAEHQQKGDQENEPDKLQQHKYGEPAGIIPGEFKADIGKPCTEHEGVGDFLENAHNGV